MELGRAAEDLCQTAGAEDGHARSEGTPGAVAALDQVAVTAGTNDAGTGEDARGAQNPAEANAHADAHVQGGGETDEDVSDMKRYLDDDASLVTVFHPRRKASDAMFVSSALILEPLFHFLPATQRLPLCSGACHGLFS